MRNVQIICAANPASTYARFGSYVMPLRSVNDITPRPLDLLLAGLGADTGQVVMDWSANTDVFVDAVYVELALHGEAPWQAIGRRIWVDGDVNDRQLGELLAVVHRSPVVEALNPGIQLRSAVARMPRPDRS